MDCTNFDQDYLPDHELQVDREKIVDYLLSEANSRGKASFFLRLGFCERQWEVLADALKSQARENKVISIVDSPHGKRYGVDGELEAPDGRQVRPKVRTVWILQTESKTLRLITTHPV